MTIIDAHIRAQALDISESFIVQAPAGSGKTELLTQRYLNLLAHAKKAPEEIIAITFTRKAAAEMRMRIIDALHFGKTTEPQKNDYKYQTWFLAQKVLEKDKTLEWHILENPNRLRILTIDALSNLLCRQTPLLSQLGANATPSENSSALYQSASERAISELFLQAPFKPYLTELLLYLDNDITLLQNLLIDLLAQRDHWLPTILYCKAHHQTLRNTLEKNLKRVILEKLQLAAETMPQQVRQSLVLCARAAGDYFKEHNPAHLVAACSNFIWEAKPDLTKFQTWAGVATLLLTQDHEWRKTLDIRNGFTPKDPNKSLLLSILTELSSYPDFKDALRDILISPPEKYHDGQWIAVNALLNLLPLLAAQLQIIFQEKNEIDFTELNLSALKALGDEDNPTDLALYLDYQIQHLLIDEFQDTSITHLHLLEKIIAGWQPNDGRTLFLVGDPMQSIYRFRNAEVGLFLRAQKQGIGPITLIPLTLSMNFRSQKNLVDWFNKTFERVFPKTSDIATGRVTFTQAIAARDPIDFSTVLYPLFNEDEAEMIITAIAGIREKNPNDSIAILVRSRAQLSPIIEKMHQQKIAFQAIDIESLYDRIEIQDLLSLTRALLHRADKIAWLALLRSPLVGLRLDDLEALVQHQIDQTIWESMLGYEKIASLSDDAKIRLKNTVYFLQNAFQTQSEHRLSLWIKGVWYALNGPAICSNLDYPAAYFSLLDKLDINKLSIDLLTDRCKKLFANSNVVEKNPIQLMTIHKSKGLEFDHVFLPGLDRQTQGDRQQLLRFCERPSLFGGNDLLMAPIKAGYEENNPIYDYLKTIEHEKQQYEMTRVLYVAATRAKKSLHLSFSLEWDEKKSILKPPKKRAFLEVLWPAIEDQLPTSPTHTAKKIIPEKSLSLFERLAIKDDVTLTDSMQPIVTINLDLDDTTPQIVGTVIHEALQAAINNPAKNNNPKKWRSRLLSLGILPNQVDIALEKVLSALKNTIEDEKGQWILKQYLHEKTEWALVKNNENRFEKSIIDRTFIDENNCRWIIDYKTSIPSENETLADFLIKEKTMYQDQLERYADFFPNEKVKLGLYFPLCKGWIEC